MTSIRKRPGDVLQKSKKKKNNNKINKNSLHLAEANADVSEMYC